MAFDPVLVGTTANDGTGDPLRTAFTRVNSNFGLAVEGPAAATDGAVALFDGTTGKLLEDGPVPGAASGLATLDASVRVLEPVGDSRNRALMAVDRRQIVAWDTFDRPNQTGLGVSDSGHTWTVASGNINISNKLAAVASTSLPQIALLDGSFTGSREIRLRSSIGQGSSVNNWIIPYFVDLDNYVRAGWNASTQVQIVLRSDGVETVASTLTYPTAVNGSKQNSWDDLRVSIDVAFGTTAICLRVPNVGAGLRFAISNDADWAAKWQPNPVNGVRLINGTSFRMGSFVVLDDNITGATW
jgi:hypothetical protein